MRTQSDPVELYNAIRCVGDARPNDGLAEIAIAWALIDIGRSLGEIVRSLERQERP